MGVEDSVSEYRVRSKEGSMRGAELPLWMKTVLQQVDELYPVDSSRLPKELKSYFDLLLPLRNMLLSPLASVVEVGGPENRRILAVAEMNESLAQVYFENGKLELSFPLDGDSSVIVTLQFTPNGPPSLRFTNTHQSQPIIAEENWQKLLRDLEECKLKKVAQKADSQELPFDTRVARLAGLLGISRNTPPDDESPDEAMPESASTTKKIYRRTFLALLGLTTVSVGTAFGLGKLGKHLQLQPQPDREVPSVYGLVSAQEQESALASLLCTPRMLAYQVPVGQRNELRAVPLNEIITSVFSLWRENSNNPGVVSVAIGGEAEKTIAFGVRGAPISMTDRSARQTELTNELKPEFDVILNFYSNQPNKTTLMLHKFGDMKAQLFIATSSGSLMTDLQAFPDMSWGQVLESLTEGSIINTYEERLELQDHLDGLAKEA